jgi:hypothetical protein
VGDWWTDCRAGGVKVVNGDFGETERAGRLGTKGDPGTGMFRGSCIDPTTSSVGERRVSGSTRRPLTGGSTRDWRRGTVWLNGAAGVVRDAWRVLRKDPEDDAGDACRRGVEATLPGHGDGERPFVAGKSMAGDRESGPDRSIGAIRWGSC